MKNHLDRPIGLKERRPGQFRSHRGWLTAFALATVLIFIGMAVDNSTTALAATTTQTAGPTLARTALINGGTVTGSPSQEEQAATAQGFVVTVVSNATWQTMTAAQFAAYDLLIIGDPTCGSATDAAAANAAVWAPVVMGTAGGRTLAGNRILISTDPVFHDGGDVNSLRATIIRTGIGFAGKQPGRTGLYLDSSCLADGPTITALNLLSTGTGTWVENAAPPCGGNVSLIASEPSFATLTTASLAGWGCSVHESWPTFKSDWSALAVATDTPTHPTCGVDPNTNLNACGEAYILIAGSSIVVSSQSITISPIDATNPVNTPHTVTAHLTTVAPPTLSGAPAPIPLVGQLVTFTVTGQNAGAAGMCAPITCKTDSNGDVSFTYVGTNGVGDDTIKASFTDSSGSLQAATAQKHWVAAAATADLAITKTDGSATYTPGLPISYSIVASNNGPGDATGATITDVVPANITGVSISCAASGTATCGTNGSSGNNVSYTGVSIPFGAANFVTITVSGTVRPTATGDLVNAATITAGTPTDGDPTNNTATDTDTILARPLLVICKQLTPNDPIPVGTTFEFTSPSFSGTVAVRAGVNGSPICSAPFSVTAAGQVTVTETAQIDTAVTGITASPADRFVSSNLPARTGVVNVPASLTPTTMTFTNQGSGAGAGYIEVCKRIFPGDVIVPGTLFTFTVTGMVNPAPVVVPAGAADGPPSCSAPILVTAGTVSVTETAVASVIVQAIDVSPTNRMVSSNLPNRTVTVAVPRGDVTNETLVTFTNQTTRTGTLEICKFTADPADTDVTGTFRFTVQGAPGIYSVQTGFCSDVITVTLPQIGASTTPFTTNVTELARDNFRLERVDSTPTGRINIPPPGFVANAGFDENGLPLTSNTNGGFTNVTLNAGGANQMVLVNFYNRSLPGRIKVCKVSADPRILSTTQFTFTVTGTAPTSSTQTLPGLPVTQTVNVLPGSCAFVPGTFIVGTPVTVTESGWIPGPGQTLTFNDVRVSRIVGNPGLTSSSLVNKTATFNARNTTAEVSFTNFIFQPTVVKLCKAAAVPGTSTTPLQATFSVAVGDTLTSWPVNPIPFNITYSAAGAGCVLLNGPFPAIAGFPGVGTFNLGTQLVVTEAASSTTTLTSITSPTGNSVTRAGQTGTITLNQVPANINEIRFVNATTPPPPPVIPVRFDFDGDGKSDKVVFRNGTWFYLASGSGDALVSIQFGQAGDKLVAADYDGDGKTDVAVYRNGTWFVLGSMGGTMAVQFGLATDIPQVGDFDGDGKADFVVFRPSDGNWYIQGSSAGFSAIHFGANGDRPVAADFDGDGKMDPAVYRGNTWYVLGSTAGFYGMQFGIVGDIPVQADYDGDHKADFAVYRNGAWYIQGSASGFNAVNFGMAGDTPVPADYDGDGKTDIAVFRPSSKTWFITQSSQSLGLTQYNFGADGDVLMNY